MKKLVLAVAAIAMLSVGSVFASRHCGSCPKPKCEKPQHTTRCEPKPKCIKRCVVESCVEPRKVCETVCHYECPPCDQVIPGGAESSEMETKKVKRSSKRMMKSDEAY